MPDIMAAPDRGDAIADDAGDAPENVPNWVANMNGKYAYVEAQKKHLPV